MYNEGENIQNCSEEILVLALTVKTGSIKSNKV
jgi:hypothetical protein